MMKKHNLTTEEKAQILSKVFETAIATKKPIRDFLIDLLTPAEIDDLLQRWNILRLLSKGKTHRDVAEELKISVSKVSRGARVLQNGSDTLEKLINSV